MTQNDGENAPDPPQSAGGDLGEVAHPLHRRDRIARLEVRALRERWGLSEAKIKELVQNLTERVPKASNRDAASITAALTSLVNCGLAEQKFELEKIKAEDGPKPSTMVNIGVGANIQQQYEERVAGRDYDELCAEIAAEAAAVTKRLESR